MVLFIIFINEMGSGNSCVFTLGGGTLYLCKDDSYIWENKHSKINVDVEISKGMGDEKIGYRDIAYFYSFASYLGGDCNIEYRGKTDDGKLHLFFCNYSDGQIITTSREDKDILKYVIRSQTGVNQFTRTVYVLN